MMLHYLATSASDNSTILTVVGISVGALGVLFGGLAAWWSTRRKNSGKIDTSEAASLWQESQSMRESLQKDKEDLRAEKKDAEEQRDRVIEAYSSQIVPMLSSINRGMSGLNESVAEVLTILRATGPLPPNDGGKL